MAQSEIIRKLDVRLRKLPIEEETAVYVLVRIRKILEFELAQRQKNARHLGQELISSSYSTLGFYCNWAVHTSLDRSSAQEFMNQVLPILTLNVNLTDSEYRKLNGLLTMRSFREELGKCLHKNCVHDELCINENYWRLFLEAYCRVVHDNKLVMKGNRSPSGPLNLAVDTVTIEASIGPNGETDRPFPMNWIVSYADGRNACFELGQEGLLGTNIKLT